MKASADLVLSIESAIAGGSISILSGGEEIGNWLGSKSISKAEDLLANIDELMKVHGIVKEDLSHIAVSAGPGSFTGIRIGLATALGLKAGLGVAMSIRSALEAMICESDVSGRVVTAVPAGRGAVCLQFFDDSVPVADPRSVTESNFAELIRTEEGGSFLLHESLFLSADPTPGAINAGANIARAIGLVCSRNMGTNTQPLFISKGF